MKIVSYYRVSTRKQEESGLGLEGQQAAVADFANRNSGQIIARYTEVESGKKADRPELSRALAHARRSKATLVVAKTDRLSRNVAFLSSLMDSGVEFVACDNPHANRLTIHILAAVAENEARQISERTKAALQAAKARGVKLGSARAGHWDGREDKRSAGLEKAQKAAAGKRKQLADEAYVDILPQMRELREAGESLRKIAAVLNEEGHTTRRGKPWNPVQVRNVLLRQTESESNK